MARRSCRHEATRTVLHRQYARRSELVKAVGNVCSVARQPPCPTHTGPAAGSPRGQWQSKRVVHAAGRPSVTPVVVAYASSEAAAANRHGNVVGNACPRVSMSWWWNSIVTSRIRRAVGINAQEPNVANCTNQVGGVGWASQGRCGMQCVG